MISSPNFNIFCDACGAGNRPQAAFCFACGQPLHNHGTKQSSPTTGLLIHNHLLKQRYRIINQIGKGGFGAVYKAADIQFGNRLLAIKEMSQNSLSQQELIEATSAFKREALLLASLTHPNLPRIYEQFTDMGRWYLVMDFIEGETLEEHLKNVGASLAGAQPPPGPSLAGARHLPGTSLAGAHHLPGASLTGAHHLPGASLTGSQFGGQGTRHLPIEKVLEIGIQLCMVLEYLHLRQPPIIFRDLKPANIMLTAHGHVYLIDFGIARHFKPGQAKDTTALGSTGYAAPEQYGRAQTTPRADIYGLGATLHQMFSGNDPSDTPFHFASLQLLGHPTLARLEKLIMQMLEMDSSKRPASIAVVKQELQSIATQYMMGKTNPLQSNVPLAYQPPVGATLGSPSWLPAMPKLQNKGARQTTLPQPQKTMRFICNGHSSRVTAVAWSPKGTHIASASYDKTVRVWDATNGSSITIYRGHWDRVQALAWSPDGVRIASASNDGTVHIWEATTGNHVLTYHEHAHPIAAIAWSPDGTRIASGGFDNTVQVWDVTSGKAVFTYRGHTDRVQAVAWSPDGKRIASGSDDKTVQVWSPVKDKNSFFTAFLFTSRGQFTYRGHYGRVNAVSWSPDGRRIASVSSDKTLQVWDSLMGKRYFIHRNPSSTINTVSWSPTGKFIASGSNDKMVQVWDAITRHSIFTYRGHASYVIAVSWSPDGKLLASGSVDRTVQVWQTS